MALLYASKEMRRLAGEFFAPSGLLFVVKPHEHEIELQKQADGVAVSFPFFELFRHAAAHGFLHAAIESNRDATLVFEEPDAHAFPFFTKHLRERIALDANKNQYFIATHNPYLLTAIWEKAPAGERSPFSQPTIATTKPG